MTREQLEHIIRAAAAITNQYEFVVVGSQAVLGALPNPPQEFTVSMEADIYPMRAPELADQIDGAIGEASDFHQMYGYYAQGVGPDTAVLPADWQQRVHRVQNENTAGRVAYCIDLPDLFLSKTQAGRDKDRTFCMGLLAHRFVTLDQVMALVPTMPLDAASLRHLRARIRRWSQAAMPGQAQ